MTCSVFSQKKLVRNESEIFFADNYEERRDRPVFSLTYEKVSSGHEVRERGHGMAVDVHDVVCCCFKDSNVMS